VERILADLGVTSPELLRHGAGIDRASYQLILAAVSDPGNQPGSPSAEGFSRSAGAAELVNSMLASGDPRAAALLPPAPARPAAQRESPQLEAGL
jgi:hypothetical protein